METFHLKEYRTSGFNIDESRLLRSLRNTSVRTISELDLEDSRYLTAIAKQLVCGDSKEEKRSALTRLRQFNLENNILVKSIFIGDNQIFAKIKTPQGNEVVYLTDLPIDYRNRNSNYQIFYENKVIEQALNVLNKSFQ